MDNLINLDPVMVMAKIGGQLVTELPKDLYIPPDALRVFLEAFEGPLDLLLYLIKKERLDILTIPIAHITHQYMQYVELMQTLNIELAAEYLVMAAILAEIKSRLLLPRPPTSEALEDDPRAELIRRLQEYERFRKAAQSLDQLERLERDCYLAEVEVTHLEVSPTLPTLVAADLAEALQTVLQRASLYTKHWVAPEKLSIRERMTAILQRVNRHQFTEFTELFLPSEGKMGIAVTLIAILELMKQAVLELVQAAPFAPIYVKAK